DLRRVRIAKRYSRKILRRFDLDHGDVRFRIDTDDGAAKLLTRLQTHGDTRCVFDHVVVCQDVALWIDDETAADAARWTSLTAEHVEQRIGRLVFLVFVFFADFGLILGGFDVDDSRFNAPRDLCERGGERFGRTGNLHVGLCDCRAAGQHRADADA